MILMDRNDPMRPVHPRRALQLEMRVKYLAQLVQRKHDHRVSLVSWGHLVEPQTGNRGCIGLAPGHGVGFDPKSVYIVEHTGAIEFVCCGRRIVCCAWLAVQSRAGIDQVDLDVLFG